MGTPSLNGSNGRSADGRFGRGNPGGPGNPYAKHTAQLRALLLESVTDDDLCAVIAKLVAMAKEGNLAAIRELLDRTLGRPLAAACDGVYARGAATLHRLSLRPKWSGGGVTVVHDR